MNSIGVHLRVEDGVSSTRLHDEWLRLFQLSTEAAKAAATLWHEWKNTTSDGVRESAESRRLWVEYSALQSDYRVLCAWRDLLHTAWVFSTDGRGSRFVTEHSTISDTLVSIS